MIMLATMRELQITVVSDDVILIRKFFIPNFAGESRCRWKALPTTVTFNFNVETGNHSRWISFSTPEEHTKFYSEC